MSSSSGTEAEDPGEEFMHLDLRTRVEVQRLAARGRRYPDPVVSQIAYRCARERLRYPLWKTFVMTIVCTFVGIGIVLGIVLAFHGRAADLVPAAVGVTVAACLSPFYLRRRLARVARANRIDQ
jgi:hypothetical protein